MVWPQGVTINTSPKFSQILYAIYIVLEAVSNDAHNLVYSVYLVNVRSVCGGKKRHKGYNFKLCTQINVQEGKIRNEEESVWKDQLCYASQGIIIIYLCKLSSQIEAILY